MRSIVSTLALTAGLLGATALGSADRQQVPLTQHIEHHAEDGYTLFRYGTVPVNHTHYPAEDRCIQRRHVDFPEKQMRYKRNDGWCDGADVRSWSGYLDFEDSHLFFYYYESRSKPSEDPVILWINGGPGCSSSMVGPIPGQEAEGRRLMHMHVTTGNVNGARYASCCRSSKARLLTCTAHAVGPCQIVEEGNPKNTTASTKFNPHSWNQNANLLFLDQPYVMTKKCRSGVA